MSSGRDFSTSRAAMFRRILGRTLWSRATGGVAAKLGLASPVNLSEVVCLAGLLFCFAFAACAGPLPESIIVGKNPIHAAITPDGSQLFVANNDDNSVSVISLGETGQARVVTIHVDGPPNPVLVAQDGKTVYVGLDRGTEAGAVEVIDAKTKAHFSVPTSGPVRDMVFSVDGGSIYLAMEWQGLGKLRLSDNSLAIIDRRACPEGLAITSKGRLFVSYQCTASGIGSSGHDPFGVFDSATDSPELWITTDTSKDPFPNVGGQLSLSPDEKQIWENGNNACSSNTEYDVVKDCPQEIKDYRGRGIINIIGTAENAVVATKEFVGKLPGSNYNLGASIPTFFPGSCNFTPARVAVSTEQDVLIFDADSRNLIASLRGVPKIPRAGSIVFSPDCQIAYVLSSHDNAVHVRTVEADGAFGTAQKQPVFQALFNWYKRQWRTYSARVATVHTVILVLLLYLVAFLSPRFASIVGRWPVLSQPLEFDVWLRKARSVLVRLYLEQLKDAVSKGLKETQAATIVALPLVRISIAAVAEGPTNTEQWIEEFIRKTPVGTPTLRVAVKGEGGQGKSVFIQHLIDQLLKQKHYAPILLRGPDYAGEVSLGAWIQKVLDRANVPLQSSVLRSVPSLVTVIDGVSEVPVAVQPQFWQLIRSEFAQGTTAKKLILAGRFLDNPDSAAGSSLPWQDFLKFGDLTDDIIRQLGAAYLDPGGPSEEIVRLPDEIRKVSSYPTAFIVSHYILARRASSRPVTTEGDLYQEILDSYVTEGKLPVRPSVAKEVLQGLVRKEYGATGTRGLPAQENLLREKVREVYTERKLADLVGPNNLSPPIAFVDALKSSGLLERVGDRYVFFHDSFEDWLLEEANRPSVFQPKADDAGTFQATTRPRGVPKASSPP